MSAFIRRAGEDPVAIRAAVESGATKAASQSDVYYRRLPHEQMLHIQQFYVTGEPIIAVVNELKNFHLLGNHNEIVATFGEQPLPDTTARNVNDALQTLLPMLRQWQEMFGFVALYDPHVRQDRYLERAHAEDEEIRYALEQNAELELERLRPLVDLPGEPLSETTDELKERLVQRQNETPDGEHVYIHREPRFSALSAPNSFAEIHGKAGSGGDLGRIHDKTEPDRTNAIKEGVRRSLLQVMTGLADIKIASLAEGRFFLEIDRLTDEQRVVYARRDRNNNCSLFNDNLSHQQDHTGDDRSRTAELVVDPDVFVYVWPGRMPMNNGRLNTKLVEVMRLRSVHAAAEENQLRADEAAANPTVMFEYQQVQNKGDITQLTDAQIHWGRGAQEDGALAERLRQEGRQLAQWEARSMIVRDQRTAEFNERMLTGMERATVRDADGVARLRKIGPSKHIPIPEGFHFAGVLPSTTVCNTPELLHNYHVALAASLGVPLTVITGGSTFTTGQTNRTGSSGGNISTGSAEISQDAMTNAIMSDRHSLGRAVSEIWDLMYRHIDNEMLTTALADVYNAQLSSNEDSQDEIGQLQRQLASTIAIADRERLTDAIEANSAYLTAFTARLSRVSRQLRRIASMKHRFEINFTRVAHIDRDTLQTLYENDGISQLEYINAIRQRAGLETLDDEGIIAANRKARLQARADEQEAELKITLKGEEARMKLSAKYDTEPTESSMQRPAKRKSNAQAKGEKKRKTK